MRKYERKFTFAYTLKHQHYYHYRGHYIESLLLLLRQPVVGTIATSAASATTTITNMPAITVLLLVQCYNGRNNAVATVFCQEKN